MKLIIAEKNKVAQTIAIDYFYHQYFYIHYLYLSV